MLLTVHVRSDHGSYRRGYRADPAHLPKLRGSDNTRRSGGLPAPPCPGRHGPDEVQGENSDLVQLGLDLEAGKTRHAAALSVLDKTRAAALKLAPAIPEGLPVPFGISVFGQIAWYSLPEPADILGNPIELPRFVSPRNGKSFPVRIPTTEDILSDRQSGRRWNHGHLPAWHKGEHRRLYDLAVKFERATDEAREASGLHDAELERYLAERALVELCVAITHAEAGTVAGILLKAQAIQACEGLPQGGPGTVAWASALLPAAIIDALGRAV